VVKKPLRPQNSPPRALLILSQQRADIHLQHISNLEQHIERRLDLVRAPARDRALAPADLFRQPFAGLFLLYQDSFDAVVIAFISFILIILFVWYLI